MVISIYSCEKKETYPIIPEIKFEDFLLHYNSNLNAYDKGILKMTFKDGDGDIGLKQHEKDPPYDYNLFITIYEILDGDTVEYIPVIIDNSDTIPRYDTIILHQRIPMLTPDGPNKSISGEIEDTLDIYNPFYQLDTVFFEFFIRDRALHESNVITTPLMKLDI
jgi:hypothetical protein